MPKKSVHFVLQLPKDQPHTYVYGQPVEGPGPHVIEFDYDTETIAEARDHAKYGGTCKSLEGEMTHFVDDPRVTILDGANLAKAQAVLASMKPPEAPAAEATPNVPKVVGRPR